MGSFGGDSVLPGSTAMAGEADASKGKEEEVTTTELRYGEMMLAMKTLYQSNKGTSSMESEHGSDNSNENDEKIISEDEAVVDDDANVAPVSEDDVDSAMEKECQEFGGEAAMIGMTSEDTNLRADKESGDLTVTTTNSSTPLQEQHQGGSSSPLANKTLFRKGYMGHVIIICQALVHACNNTISDTSGDPNVNDEGAVMEEDAQCSSPLSSPSSMEEISSTSSFETSAVVPHPSTAVVQHDDDSDAMSTCSNNSKKRKDRSPIRDGCHEDIKRLASSPPIAANDSEQSLSSPTATCPIPIQVADANTQAAAPSPEAAAVEKPRQLSIGHLLRRHPLHDQWQHFVTSVLASEMSVQSTPLGGGQQQQQQMTNESEMQEGQIMPSAINNDNNCNADFLDTDQGSGPSSCVNVGNGGGMISVGEIDMDENDLDIAASMMEALSLPPSSTSQGGGGGDSPPVGHRRRGVVGGGGSLLVGNSNQTSGSGSVEKGSSSSGSIGGNFGSVIQQHHTGAGFKDYVYDDPLGGVHPFGSGDNDSDDDEEKNHGGLSNNSSEDYDDGFMSDAMVVSKEDGGVTTGSSSGGSNDNGNIKRSWSNSSSEEIDDDDDNDDDDDDVPVLDLFAGSFQANFANFDAFESSCSTTTSNTMPSNNGNPFERNHENKRSSSGGDDDDFFAAIDNNNGGGRDRGASGGDDDDFFAAINSNDDSSTTDNAKAEDSDATALFEFSKTPFDMVDSLSSSGDAENENNEGDGKTQ